MSKYKRFLPKRVHIRFNQDYGVGIFVKVLSGGWQFIPDEKPDIAHYIYKPKNVEVPSRTPPVVFTDLEPWIIDCNKPKKVTP